eukprot:COSAG02_NODE_8476_length_2557_cov_2.189992_2_plen_142_part_00
MRRAFDLDVLAHLRDKTYELQIEDDTFQPMKDGNGDASPANRVEESASRANEDELDCGMWWSSWLTEARNFHQVMQRCDAATGALQLVATAADAAAGEWKSGPEQRGRIAALRQQRRRLHRELTTRANNRVATALLDENAL